MRVVNPVLDRELRERMRTGRAAIVITVYLTLLAAVMWFVYSAQAGDSVAASTGIDPFTGMGGIQATEVASIGRGIFEWILFFMLLLVLFLVPGLTSGAVSGERERQTLVPLQVTLLRPRSIVFGKLGASIAFLCLLLVASAPLLAVAYLIGGVSMDQVLGALGAVLAVGVILAAMTVGCSALTKRTQTATVLAYAVTLLFVLGTFLVYAVATLAVEDDGTEEEEAPPEAILYLNPVVMTADVIGGRADATLDTSSPFDPIRDMVATEEEGEELLVDEGFRGVGVVVGPGGRVFEQAVFEDGEMGVEEVVDDGGGGGADDEDGTPFWVRSLALLGALGIIGVVVATRRLRTPARTER